VSELTDRIVGTASTGLTMTDKDRSEGPPITPPRAPHRRQTEVDAARHEKNEWKARALAAEQRAATLRARAENVAVMLDGKQLELDGHERALLVRLWEALRG
jgi:hypothetical protein